MATPEFNGKQGREGSWKSVVCLSCRFVCRDPLIKTSLLVPSPCYTNCALQLIFFAYLGSIRISQIVKVCRIIRKKIHLPRAYTHMSTTTTKFTFILWLLTFYISMRSVQEEDCNYFYQMNWCLVVCCHFYDIISTRFNSFFSFFSVTSSNLQSQYLLKGMHFLTFFG